MAAKNTTEAMVPKTRKPREATVYELEQQSDGHWESIGEGNGYPDTDSAKKDIRDNGWEGEFRVVVVKWQGKATKKVAESIELT